MNHEWLFQLFTWNCYQLFGNTSLIMIKLLLTSIIAISIFKTTQLLTKSNSAALWGTLLVLAAIADRVMMRPFLFTLMFLPYFILQLHRYEKDDKRNLWELPFLTLIWINLHAGGLLAPPLVFAFALGETIQAAFSKRLGDEVPKAINTKRIYHLWVVGFLCTIACMITPYGIETLTFPLSHLGMGSILQYTQEWLPFLDPRLDGIISQILARTLLALLLISYFINRKSVRISHLLLTIITALMLLKGKRFTSHFVIANLPILFFNLKILARRIPITPGAGYLHSWGNLIVVGMLSLLALRHGVPSTIGGDLAGSPGLGSVHIVKPAAVDMLDKYDIHGKVFNELGVGSYFLFKRWPRDKVFIDGRTPVYGDTFFLDYIDALRHPKNFETLDKKYNFDYLVFNSYQAWPLRHMHRYFWYNPDWKLIFANQDGIIYLRNTPKHHDLIEKLELKIHPLIEEMKRKGEIGTQKITDIKK